MWRINFDHRTGMFIVQFLRFGLWWATVCQPLDGKTTIRAFETYAAARTWAFSIGLNTAFSEQGTLHRPLLFHPQGNGAGQ